MAYREVGKALRNSFEALQAGSRAARPPPAKASTPSVCLARRDSKLTF